LVFSFYLYYLFKTIRTGPVDIDKPLSEESLAFQYMAKRERGDA